MKNLLLITFSILLSMPLMHGQKESYFQFSNFRKFAMSNKAVGPLKAGERRVVFMGNSITQAWPEMRPQFFTDHNYHGRGISGQVTSQMLLRFREDVINLEPEAVVILAGINDIAQNRGYTPLSMIVDNIKTMTELAEHHGISVILCSVLPAIDFPWSPYMEPVEKVLALNKLIAAYAKEKNLPYVDYHTAMKDKNNGLKVPEYTSANDLVHPNVEGYKVMESLLHPVIQRTLEIRGK